MRQKKINWLIGCMVLFLASPLSAAIERETWTLTPFAGGYAFDSRENLKPMIYYGLKLGYDFTEYFGLEMHGGAGATKLKSHWQDDAAGNTVDALEELRFESYNVRLDSLIYLLPDSPIVPFVSLGVGTRAVNMNEQPAYANHAIDKSQSNIEGAIGLGVKAFLNKNLALRADARYLGVFNDRNYNVMHHADDGDGSENRISQNFEATLGLSFVFGHKKPAPAPVAAPAPAPVVEEPAPAPAPVVEEPAPAPVLAPTVMEKEITEKGKATLDIKFKTGKADIQPQYRDELAQFAEVVKRHPELKFELAGHTDNVGSAQANQKLSQARVDSAKKYLVNTFGIDGARINAKGYGESKPVADNKTAAGRLQNRRVEAVVEYTETVKEKVQE